MTLWDYWPGFQYQKFNISRGDKCHLQNIQQIQSGFF